MATAGKQTVARSQGDGDALRMGEGLVTVKVSSEETAGTFSVIEYELSPGWPGPPLHVHPRFDEFFYILEGTVTFGFKDEKIEAAPGTTVFNPGTNPHTISNPGDERAKMLMTMIPGGFEDFFRDVAAAGTNGKMPSVETMIELSAKHGVEPVV